jgi:hypothetical protein
VSERDSKTTAQRAVRENLKKKSEYGPKGRVLRASEASLLFNLLSNLLIETVFGLEGAEEGVLGQALGDNVLSKRAGVVIGVV